MRLLKENVTIIARAMHEELFKSIRKRVTLSEEDVALVRNSLIPKKVRKRQYILNSGDVCQHIVFVEKGLLRGFSVDESGNEHVIQFALEGWWISDMASFFSGTTATYSIEALEDSELLLLTRPAHDELLDKVPGLERYFRILMQNHIVALQLRIGADHTFTAEEKYLKLMNLCPSVISRAPQQHIASYLGITPETLSRVRKQIAKQDKQE